ncbi:BRO-C [Betabaculovirus altermyunipunctae]|uniref:BRO-C n=1 Tax=Betabaculovirus altermyunipunctae TaxID=3051996 RepID=A0A1S5YDY4_9BBAC|nr:BRO-C [Betabaculovirus altermyunipunctae]AQQ80329.1 BRO-C [Betabaculovirus altermyunipunctae]
MLVVINGTEYSRCPHYMCTPNVVHSYGLFRHKKGLRAARIMCDEEQWNDALSIMMLMGDAWSVKHVSHENLTRYDELRARHNVYNDHLKVADRHPFVNTKGLYEMLDASGEDKEEFQRWLSQSETCLSLNASRTMFVHVHTELKIRPPPTNKVTVRTFYPFGEEKFDDHLVQIVSTKKDDTVWFLAKPFVIALGCVDTYDKSTDYHQKTFVELLGPESVSISIGRAAVVNTNSKFITGTGLLMVANDQKNFAFRDWIENFILPKYEKKPENVQQQQKLMVKDAQPEPIIEPPLSPMSDTTVIALSICAASTSSRQPVINLTLNKMTYKIADGVCDLHIVKVLEEGKETIMVSAKPIAKLLGYKHPKNSVAKHVKPEWRKNWAEINGNFHRPSYRDPEWGPSKIDINFNVDLEHNTNIHPDTVFITEAGVYALIVRSKLPEAEKFRVWLFEEVLPSIRKTGGYQSGQVVSDQMVEKIHADLDLELEKSRQINSLINVLVEKDKSNQDNINMFGNQMNIFNNHMTAILSSLKTKDKLLLNKEAQINVLLQKRSAPADDKTNILVYRKENIIIGVVAKRAYVEAKRRKMSTNVVVSVECSNPNECWQAVVQACNDKYGRFVKRNKRLEFFDAKDADDFEAAIKREFEKGNLWDMCVVQE